MLYATIYDILVMNIDYTLFFLMYLHRSILKSIFFNKWLPESIV